jgi:hypothetical protein
MKRPGKAIALVAFLALATPAHAWEPVIHDTPTLALWQGRAIGVLDGDSITVAQIIFSRSGWCASLLCGLGNSRLAATHMREFAVLVAPMKLG